MHNQNNYWQAGYAAGVAEVFKRLPDDQRRELADQLIDQHEELRSLMNEVCS